MLMWDFPEQLWVSVLTDWLQLADIVSLDSALCNRRLRPAFLALLNSSGVTLPAIQEYFASGYKQWVLTRQVRVRQLYLRSAEDFLSLLARQQLCRGIEILYVESLHEFPHALAPIAFPFKLRQLQVPSTQLLRVLPLLRQQDFSCLHLLSLRLSVINCSLVTLLPSLSALEVLDLRSCRFSKITFLHELLRHEWPALVTLRVTEVSGLTDESWTTFIMNNCVRLRVLEVSSCKDLSDAALCSIQACSQLEQLSVAGMANVTTSTVSEITSRCRQLTIADLSYCNRITDAAVVCLAEHCEQLRQLSLSFCSRITDSAMMRIAECCAALVFLDLHYCFRISDVGLVALACGCTALEVLSLSHQFRPSSLSVAKLSTQLMQLRRLDLTCFASANDDCLIMLASSPAGSMLQHLNISGCTRVTDAGLLAILGLCTRIEWLDVSDNPHLSDVFLLKLLHKGIANCLRFLNIQYCPGLSADVIHEVKLSRLHVFVHTAHTDIDDCSKLRTCTKGLSVDQLDLDKE